MDTQRTSLPSRQSQAADRLRADLRRRLGPQLLTRVVVDQPLPSSRVELDPDPLTSTYHAHINVPVVYRNLPLAIHPTRHGALRQVVAHSLRAPRAGLVHLPVGAAAVRQRGEQLPAAPPPGHGIALPLQQVVRIQADLQ